MKEVDFQNRKILFDSSCIRREVLSGSNSIDLSQYDEIANNYGYKVKPKLCGIQFKILVYTIKVL